MLTVSPLNRWRLAVIASRTWANGRFLIDAEWVQGQAAAGPVAKEGASPRKLIDG